MPIFSLPSEIERCKEKTAGILCRDRAKLPGDSCLRSGCAMAEIRRQRMIELQRKANDSMISRKVGQLAE
jgi:hypothetical protein